MFWMVLAFLSVFLILALIGIASMKRLHDRITLKERQFNAFLREWVESPNSETPSKFAMLTDVIGRTVGQATAQSIMASLNAEKSHVARVAGGLTDDLQAQANPLVALLAGGKRGKHSAVLKLAELLGTQLLGQGNGKQADQPYTRKHHE